MGRLSGKVVLITGAGAGIGRSAAVLFASEGAAIAVSDLHDETGIATVRQIQAFGGSAAFVQTDITDPRSVSSAVESTIEKFGRLDVLYNNAGGSSAQDRTVTEACPETFWEVVKLNLFGVWNCCHYAIPAIIESGGGSVINTTSISALEPVPGRHAYSTAKGGVISLTRAMSSEYASQGVRVNALAPGFTASERIEKQFADLPQDYANRLRSEHPLGLGKPENVAAFALFLASDESRFTTGQIFPVNNEIRT